MSESSTHSRPSPRRPSRRVKTIVITFLVLANVMAGLALYFVYTGRNFLASADTDDEVTGALDGASGGALTFLIVGSDTREGLDDLTSICIEELPPSTRTSMITSPRAPPTEPTLVRSSRPSRVSDPTIREGRAPPG